MTPLKVNYQMCNPQGCHGGIAVSRTSLNAMLKAKKLTVFYQEPLGRKIGIPFAVKQFKTSWEKFKVDPQWRTVKSNDSL
jgi:invasion protein IalB